MNDKKTAYILVGLPAVAIAFFLGLYVGGDKASSVAGSVKVPDSIHITDSDMEPFWKVWQALQTKYVGNSTTTDQEKVYGAISGLAASYKDPYTVFFPPVESKMFQEEISGNFEGVGMEIGVKDGKLVVVTPIKNSPAYKAGVKAGDRIIAIDDKPSSEMPVDKAVKLIRGKKGTVVKIMFLPKDAVKGVERSITRDIIDIPTIEAGIKTDNVFVIRLYSFTAQSPELFHNALLEFVKSGSNKLVVDLRGNPGGYLDAAWDIASWFLPAGKVVVTEDFGKNSPPKIYYSKGYNIFPNKIKLAVLVDAGSASASEILAGALQEQGEAKLVGVKTFGKGSVQELMPITSDTSLKVTIARWLTPKGHNLSHDGLEPDYKVEITEKDLVSTKDPQLEKAIEILKD